jgi:hypothetical protein
MFQAVLIVACLLVGAPVFAQSTYVTGGVGIDVLRSDRIEGRGITNQTADGEAVAFSLGVGTAITNRWGVELAFTRPSEIEREGQAGYPIPLITRATPVPVPVPAGYVIPDLAIPTFQSRVHLERRNTTLDAVAWARQAVGRRVDLVYLGGIAFSRVTETQAFDFSRLPILIFIAPISTRTITYGVGPVVGVDARLDLTEHVMLVPGVRLHGIDDNEAGGWLLRSSVSLGWRF